MSLRIPRLPRRPLPPPPIPRSFPRRPFSTPSPTPSAPGAPGPEPTSAYAKFKALSKKYGSYAIGMYFFLSSLDFSASFLLVHAVGAERIEPFLDEGKAWYRSKRYGEEKALRLKAEDERSREEEAREAKKDGKVEKNKWFGRTFWAEVILAYTIHKTLLLPFRAGLTVAWTPKFVGWLTKQGWVGKGGLTRAATHAQGKVKNASVKVKDRVKRQP
ncbi:peptide alpha-N-acetyltransferase [Cryptococcus wingfieldii CBS 7118]|uniref:Peptide alpha-N-acetyltransferase n=1 Tax=Cryptococcus wingfieldii CBS 7118 TaxID=1295528 RepID=A0A1E3HSN6_9TREE|nr:peptide alpha-N-acetyltransferase [Cryptococcus wingfieldii CBS 7118]ODN79155.1 peptide alpha-N-acetyltransferase [Cryptococcus wingfieldii CBS 7118]